VSRLLVGNESQGCGGGELAEGVRAGGRFQAFRRLCSLSS